MSLHGGLGVIITALLLFAALLNHQYNQWNDGKPVQQNAIPLSHEPKKGVQRTLLRKHSKHSKHSKHGKISISKLRKAVQEQRVNRDFARREVKAAHNKKDKRDAKKRLSQARAALKTAKNMFKGAKHGK